MTDTHTNTSTSHPFFFSFSLHASPPFLHRHNLVPHKLTNGNGYSTLGVPVLLNPLSSSSYSSITDIDTGTNANHPLSFSFSQFPSLPFLLSISRSVINRHRLMGQYLSPNNWVSDRIRARPASTVAAMADGGALMPDDGGLEETTVALTSSRVLQGTCGCTLTLGMALFGATPSWPCGRTKLHRADALTPHTEEGEEEEEKQVRYLSIAFFPLNFYCFVFYLCSLDELSVRYRVVALLCR